MAEEQRVEFKDIEKERIRIAVQTQQPKKKDSMTPED